MPARIIVTGFILVIMTSLTVCCIELFVPLSAKAEMNNCCRNALLKMEIDGGMGESGISQLNASLSDKGFTNISITATSSARQGEPVNLEVSADFSYYTAAALFDKTSVTRRMLYNRTSIGRKVVN